MRRLGVAMPSGAASGIALRGPSKLDAWLLGGAQGRGVPSRCRIGDACHAPRRRGARDVGAGGRGLLGLVPIEDALGAVELARHVLGVVPDLPGRAPQRVVGDVRAKHARLDAGGLDDVPDRLIVPVEVVREPDPPRPHA
jgi:hypothetical protein